MLQDDAALTHVQISQTITWIEAAYVFGTLAVLGIILCATAALFATNKYIRTSYDDMFK